MKKIYSLTVLVVGLCGIGYCQDEAAICEVTTPPLIDGKTEDWQGDWKTDDDSKMQYNVCFDADNLYVRLKISDDITQAKIGRFGLTLWLDPNGKKKQNLGLEYPTPTGRDFSAIDNPGNQRQTGNREEARLQMKRDLIKDTEVLELIGLAKDNIVSSRVGLKNGIQVVIVMEEKGDYVYEAKIPFKAYRLSKASIPVLGLGFETGKYVAKNVPIGARQYNTSPMLKATFLWLSLKLNQ